MRETYLPRDEVVVLVYIFCGRKKRKKKEGVFVIQPTLNRTTNYILPSEQTVQSTPRYNSFSKNRNCNYHEGEFYSTIFNQKMG